MKRETSSAFDVAMGAYDGAGVRNNRTLYFAQTTKKSKHSVLAYMYSRDDGLVVLRKCSGSQAEHIRKQIRLFKSLGLKITTDTNLKTVNFLDLTLSLQTGTHKPYRMPNDKPMYMNVDSNHPPSVIRNIPKAVEKKTVRAIIK